MRQHTHGTPIAVGEVFNSIWDCKQLIEEQLIDYIRTTLTHAGGITGMRRIAYLLRCIRYVLAHRWLLPICHQSAWAARCTLICGSPISVSRSTWVIPKQMLKSSRTTGTFDNGYMHPGDKPGLGIEFDEKLAAKYPYEPADHQLQPEDGTLWNGKE
ncbi:enolase C-terminal domain-like protein [Shigella flexneri]